MSDVTITDGLGERGASASLSVLGAEWRDWVALLKPRVVTLVVLTGVVGMVIAPGHLHPVLALTAILCVGIGAGAAGAINMWYDRDIDAVMRRTQRRPIPAGRIAPGEALGFGVALAIASVVVLGLATNMVAASVLAISILFYVVIYTMWLKRRTPQNIVIGGAAGAFPAIIGWAAVTGDVGVMPLLLFAIVFFWTPPHFWALSLYACADYDRAGVPMLPVVAGFREARRQILLYTIVLWPVAVLPWTLGYTGPVYGWTAAGLGCWFLFWAVRVFTDKQDAAGKSLTNDAPARRMFRFSLAYLAVLFLAVAVDHFIG
jgi:protoheme IX farnesyltransferase